MEKELAQLDAVRNLIEQVAQEEGRMTLRDLAVNGKDLAGLGIAPGPCMGKILNELFNAVLGEEVLNEKAPLLEMAKNIWRRAADHNE